jgi:iron complex outermembrane receptor protein
MLNHYSMGKSRHLIAIAALLLSISLLMTAPPASAAEDDDLEFILEDVVVTAQKREQKYVDVPVSVSTVQGETLDMVKVREFPDLVQVSPSLTYNQTGDQRGVGILVRGIGTTNFQTAVEPTVSTVVDGVVLGRTAQFITDLADIERVEILRGPQGTLFGKNASAGLINIITKRPSSVFTASMRGSVTDDEGWGLSGMVSGPLTDNVRGRIAAFKKEYDGFGRNLFTGHDINGFDNWGVRGKLDIDFTDKINLYLIGDYSKQDRNCCTFLLEDSGGDRFTEWDYAQYGISLDHNEKNNVTLDAEDGFSNTETYGFSGELNFDFSEFTLTSITAYREYTLESNQGIDGLPYTTPTYGRMIFTSNGAYDGLFQGGDQSQDQFSEELRVATTAWDKVRLTGGLYYWKQTVDRYFERQVEFCAVPAAGDLTKSPDPALTPCIVGLSPGGFFTSITDFENKAVFGQGEFSFADRWTLTAGLRYTQDDLSISFDRHTTPGPAVSPPGSGSSSTSETNLSGKISLQYDLTDDVMVYTSYGTGYKAPAFDLIFGSTQERIENPVPAETSEAWEAGMKGELLNKRLRLGLTWFHTKFDHLQGQSFDPDAIVFLLTSAGSAITQGLELDLTGLLTRNWLINGGASYTDATYDSYKGGQCYTGQTEAQGCIGGVQDLSGTKLPNAPEWKFSIQTRYDIELNMPFNVFISGAYRWQNESVGEVTHNPLTNRESYGVLDAMVGLEADDRAWNVQLFVKNLLDDFYVDLKNPSGAGIAHYLNRDANRYIGVEFEYRFGAR